MSVLSHLCGVDQGSGASLGNRSTVDLLAGFLGVSDLLSILLGLLLLDLTSESLDLLGPLLGLLLEHLGFGRSSVELLLHSGATIVFDDSAGDLGTLGLIATRVDLVDLHLEEGEAFEASHKGYQEHKPEQNGKEALLSATVTLAAVVVLTVVIGTVGAEVFATARALIFIEELGLARLVKVLGS